MSAPLRGLTGYLPSPPDPADFHERNFAKSSLAGTTGTSRPSIDATGTHIQRYQQANSCVGYTTDTAIQDFDLMLAKLGIKVRVAKLGDDGLVLIDPKTNLIVVEDEPVAITTALPLLACGWKYNGARRLWFKLNAQPIPASGIPDGGSSYRANIQWSRDVENGGGCRAESVWPETPENTPRVPSADADQADPLVKVDEYLRIHGEGNPDALRDGGCAALEGFLAGQCAKPMTSLAITQGFGDVKEGDVYDPKNSGPVVGSHAMLWGGYDGPNDAAILHHTWLDVAATVRVRITDLADPSIGGESWVIRNMTYIPRRAA